MDQSLGEDAGSHTARFGEIEQRGVALTPKGRRLYDALLNKTRAEMGRSANESNSDRYYELLAKNFTDFPDDYTELHDQELAYFAYYPTNSGRAKAGTFNAGDLKSLIAEGALQIEPIVYEDFLPVSAAGIFQSNLGEGGQAEYAVDSNQVQFEEALGAKVLNELKLYAEHSARTLAEAKAVLRI